MSFVYEAYLTNRRTVFLTCSQRIVLRVYLTNQRTHSWNILPFRGHKTEVQLTNELFPTNQKIISSLSNLSGDMYVSGVFLTNNRVVPRNFLTNKRIVPRAFLTNKKTVPRAFLTNKRIVPRAFLINKRSLPYQPDYNFHNY